VEFCSKKDIVICTGSIQQLSSKGREPLVLPALMEVSSVSASQTLCRFATSSSSSLFFSAATSSFACLSSYSSWRAFRCMVVMFLHWSAVPLPQSANDCFNNKIRLLTKIWKMSQQTHPNAGHSWQPSGLCHLQKCPPPRENCSSWSPAPADPKLATVNPVLLDSCFWVWPWWLNLILVRRRVLSRRSKHRVDQHQILS
jgi:hypothetical protein